MNEDNDFEDAWNEDEDNLDTLVNRIEQTEVEPEDPDDVLADDTTFEEDADDSDDTDEEEPDATDYKSLYEKTQFDLKSTDGRLNAERDRFNREKDELLQKLPKAPLEPSDEDTFLTNFKEKYSDDVLKAIDIVTGRKATELFNSQVASRIAPLEQSTNEVISRAHFSSIEAAHPDVYSIDESPQFSAWIDSRPAHVQNAYRYVRDNGTPTEVISMLNEYKATMTPQNPKAPPVSAAKLASASAVPTRRGSLPSAAAPAKDDFASAWDEAPD